MTSHVGSKERNSDKCDSCSQIERDSSVKTSRVQVAGASTAINRREFLKLSALATGGGLATIILASSLKPLVFASQATTQLLQQRQATGRIALMEQTTASSVSALDPTSIPQFENQLAGLPPAYQPKVVTSQGKVIRHDYTVAMASFNQQVLPPSMNLLTPVWGYGGPAMDSVTGAPLGFVQSTPGPTFEAVRGIPIKVEWQNNISSSYMFAVDPTIHWANPNNNPMTYSSFPAYPPGFPNVQSPVPLVTHLHGGENQSYSDGGPNEWFTSDGKHGSDYYTYENASANASVYYYPNIQQPTTLWYHDHALGVTRLNVGSGLAGFYLIRELDKTKDKVAGMLPSGKYEIPLVIQDRSFNDDGTFNYPSVGSVTDTHPYWSNTFLGNVIVVNGKAWPNMNIDRGQYRFRILNGSNSRFYGLNFSNNMSFVQIGSDGGYLRSPASLNALILAPAERADIIVDFSSLKPGEKVVLQNGALLTHTSGEMQTVGQVMQFTANDAQGTTPFNLKAAPNPFNPTLSGPSFPTLSKPKTQRVLTLYEIAGSNGLTVEALLDGQKWDATVSETPAVGSIEDWVIINPTMDAHPIHIHLVQFQLVERQQISAIDSYVQEWLSINGKAPFTQPTRQVKSLSSYLYATVTPPQPQEQGWKDTITVNAGEVVTVRMRFAQQDGSAFPFDATTGPGYVWHCHLLEHEDNEMMRPYKLIEASTAAPSSNTLPIVAVGVAAGAAVLSSAYLYQKKRKRKTTTEETGGEQTEVSDADKQLQAFNQQFDKKHD